MDKKYITLFKELAQSSAVSAETVMEYDRQSGDVQGLQTATMMRDDFQKLADEIDAAGDEYTLNRDAALKLTAAAMIMVNQLQDKITMYKRSITGYQSELLPKLQEILDKGITDDEVAKLANEKFILDNNN